YEEMFSSLPQLVTSISRMREVHPFFGYAFLAFKKFKLPIGQTREFKYTYIRDEILEKYYKVGGIKEYFNPFKTTTQWLAPRYESTSLQRIIADTFSTAFLHTKGSSKWGWQPDYVDRLVKIITTTRTKKVPILDLAIWLYRTEFFRQLSENELIN